MTQNDPFIPFFDFSNSLDNFTRPIILNSRVRFSNRSNQLTQIIEERGNNGNPRLAIRKKLNQSRGNRGIAAWNLYLSGNRREQDCWESGRREENPVSRVVILRILGASSGD